ncbi:site-specific DNA-methyltransferase [Metallumcola ferriviriculae]|uniref:Site-specific DNA-methyltransferase n=1 Tax=Metallumcola ferriviriculae TaxID=3039180 RepID=A0AAU0USY1_9FIRM|nr:site-specific DNA-methyltransferase [Desulfitibacteraceae bacterium MK1]
MKVVRVLGKIRLNWDGKDKWLLALDEQGLPIWGEEEDLTGYPLNNCQYIGNMSRLSGTFLDGNLLIKGDNLYVLKALEKDFTGKIQCIYIDPPFNAANGTMGYMDEFDHGIWLSMMQTRLAMVKRFLKPSGTIFIHIGYEEKSYLKVLADEIFGRDNFVSEITWQRAPDGRTVLGQGSSVIPHTSEYLLVYAKDIDKVKVYEDKKVVLATDQVLRQYNQVLQIHSPARLVAENTDRRGNIIRIYRYGQYSLTRFKVRKLRAAANQWLQRHSDAISRIECGEAEQSLLTKALNQSLSFDNLTQQAKRVFLTENFSQMVQSVSIQKESTFQQRLLLEMGAKDVLYRAEYTPSKGKRRGEQVCDYFLNGRKLLFLKDYSQLVDGHVYRRVDINDVWKHEEINVTGTAREGGCVFKRSKKPESLLKRVIEFATEEGDWVMDCFLGSGTTAAVAHKLGRRWVAIEVGDHAETICLPRLKRVVSGEDASGISKQVGWHGGGGFGYFTLNKI